MLYLASDHAGFHLKKEIADHLNELGIDYVDSGPFEYQPTDDYPDYIIPAAQKVAEKPGVNKGIILGGSGQGEAIAANKVRGIRAVVYYGGPMDIISLSKQHNNANVLSLGARFLTINEIKEIIKLWLNTPFSGEARHLRRIEKINDFEMKR